MRELHKRAKLPDLQGVLFTDPSYEPETWCRYESDVQLKDWVIDYRAADREDDGYRFTEFVLTIASPKAIDLIEIGDDLDSLSLSKSFSESQCTVGCDTACMYMGPTRTFGEEWQPSCALPTGADGEFGTVFQLSKESGVEAIVLFAFIDASTVTSPTRPINSSTETA